MKRSKSIVWGLALIILGIIWCGAAFDLYNIDLFFDGWWTLFIIIPSIVGVLCDSDKTSNFITLVIGVLLLLACQDIIDFDLFWKLLIPVIIILVGISLVFKGGSFKDAPKSVGEHINAVFSSQELKVDDEFKGTNITTVFGGIDLNLKNAQINNDVTINVTSVFGGVDIFVPSNVKVKVKSTSIFGGVDNTVDDSANGVYTIYINATCVFGGVDIK